MPEIPMDAKTKAHFAECPFSRIEDYALFKSPRFANPIVIRKTQLMEYAALDVLNGVARTLIIGIRSYQRCVKSNLLIIANREKQTADHPKMPFSTRHFQDKYQHNIDRHDYWVRKYETLYGDLPEWV